MSQRARLWVIKIGGSLLGAPQLPLWLRAVVPRGLSRVLLVPGGGAFADSVRVAQEHWRFADRAAHHMALLAMEQSAVMLAALEPRLRPVLSEGEMQAAWEASCTPVWLPTAMTLAAADVIESTWCVTSDSLAAWLAQRLNASRLVLVKSSAAAPPTLSIPELAVRGVLDEAFPEYARRLNCEIFCLGVDAHESLASSLDRDLPAFPALEHLRSSP